MNLVPYIHALVEDMLTCFNFKRHFEEPPQDSHKQAVVRLADYFRSRADTMVWPDFEYVSHTWPEAKEIQRQFHVFCRILRDNRGRSSWRRTVAARVSLLQPQLLTGLSKAGLEGCFRMLPSSCHIPGKQVLRIITGRVNAFLERAPSFSDSWLTKSFVICHTFQWPCLRRLSCFNQSASGVNRKLDALQQWLSRNSEL